MVLCGGVGGARMVRALSTVLPPDGLTAVVNVGDDDNLYGVRVCADLDTVIYTLAGREGTHGWGLIGDTFAVMDQLEGIGVDTRFRLGDQDLALCLERTRRLGDGQPLSAITADIAQHLDVAITVLPASDDMIGTKLKTDSGEWLDFQDYFVLRRHADAITEVRFDGADAASAAPGVVDAITAADRVVIAPSNPVVSVWPILAIDSIKQAVIAHPDVVAVSPLFGGEALKGPAAQLLSTLGLGSGNAAILDAYEGLITTLIVDAQDADDAASLTTESVTVRAMPTLMTDIEAASKFATQILEIDR